MKPCRKCGQDFEPKPYQLVKRDYMCRPCARLYWGQIRVKVNASKRNERYKQNQMFRAWYFRKTYGITLEQYDSMLAEQGGGCGICGRKPPFGRLKYLSVDHDHATGRIRGLLCGLCNSFLGRVNDDPQKAVDYVRNTQEKRQTSAA